MAYEPNPRPLYHSPTALGRGRQRRSSSRRSFTSSALPPTIESPRTLCPRDGDAFTYKPKHLPRWLMSPDLWEVLPAQLRSAVAAMQHAGAAVLTGIERMEQHSGNIDIGPGALSPEIGDDVLVQLDDSIPNLPSLPPRLTTEGLSSSAISTTSSETGSPMSMSASMSASLSASQAASPVSPISLTPADVAFPSKRERERERERSFSTPLEPHNAYFTTELSQLRTESLPRLRHAARKVDTEWLEVKRSGTLLANHVDDFENWWAEKKATIHGLNEKVNQLSGTVGVAPTGMGWTAP